MWQFSQHSQVNAMKDKRLLQYLLEEKNSFRNLKRLVMEDMKTAQTMKEWDEAKQSIDKYRNSTYYPSKTARVQGLKTPTEEIIVIGLMAIALQPKDISPIQGIVSMMAGYLGEDMNAVKTAAEILVLMADADLCDIYPAGNQGKSIAIGRKFNMSRETQNVMKRIHYPLPMVCKPKEIISGLDRSHLNGDSSLILGKEHQHEEYLCIDVVNKLNGIELSLDEYVLEYSEQPSKELDTPEKQDQFNDLNQQSTEIYQEMLDYGNEFYLTWKYDFRGRLYSSGYHIQIQSYDYKKALINTTNKRIIK